MSGTIEGRSVARSTGRLLGVAVVATVLALVLLVGSGGVAVAYPNSGYVVFPAALGVFIIALRWMMKKTDGKPVAPIPLDPEYESKLFDSVLTELRKADRAPRRQAGSLLVISLVAFVAIGAGGGNSLSFLAILIPILVFHELGHLAAMKAFGYRDLSVFFIPMIGAAATGKKERAPAWQRAIVSLMGPAPGLVLGVIGVLVLRPHGHTLVATALNLAIAVNALNLLPFEPFDGGRLASILVFSNYPRGRVVFGALTSVVLGVGAFVADQRILAFIAMMTYVAIVSSRYIAACAARTRARHRDHLDDLPPHLALANEGFVRELFTDYRENSPRVSPRWVRAELIAKALRAVHDLAVLPSPSIGAALALGVAYMALLIPSLFVVRVLFR